MALPQRDNLIDAIKRADALLERAVMMGDEAEAERLREKLEEEIDSIVYKLYGLTDDEIAVVEKAVKKA